jgi:DNA-binding XRE family transcriptional regulator
MIKSEIEKKRTLDLIDGIEKSRQKTEIALDASGIFETEKRRLILGQNDAIVEDLKKQLELYQSLKNGESTCLPQLSPGQKLIAVRILSGLTQRELAERLGISQAAINKDERNEYSGASFEKLSRVAFALECQLEVKIEGLSLSPNKNRRSGKERRAS